MKEGGCFRCRKKGHVSKDCPTFPSSTPVTSQRKNNPFQSSRIRVAVAAPAPPMTPDTATAAARYADQIRTLVQGIPKDLKSDVFDKLAEAGFS